jgi:hypothetical protein
MKLRTFGRGCAAMLRRAEEYRARRAGISVWLLNGKSKEAYRPKSKGQNESRWSVQG